MVTQSIQPGEVSSKSSRMEPLNHPARAIGKTLEPFLPLRVLRSQRSKMGRGPGRGVSFTIFKLLATDLNNLPIYIGARAGVRSIRIQPSLHF